MSYGRSTLTLISVYLLALIVMGCSGSNPVSTDKCSSPDNDIPMLQSSSEVFSGTGIMGTYEMSIDPDTMEAELVSKRSNSIGEDYIVSGIGFFTIAPCSDYLSIQALSVDIHGNIVVGFKIKHPFAPGDPGLPPTAANRLDLDVFDLALIVRPLDITPIAFPLTGSSAIPGPCMNADGFTADLNHVIDEPSALPYYLIVDDSITGLISQLVSAIVKFEVFLYN